MQFVNNTFGLSIYTDWSPENQKQFPFSVLIIAIKLLSSTFFFWSPAARTTLRTFAALLKVQKLTLCIEFSTNDLCCFLDVIFIVKTTKAFFRNLPLMLRYILLTEVTSESFASFVLFLSLHAWHAVFSFFFFVVVLFFFFCSLMSWIEISKDITSNRICTK